LTTATIAFKSALEYALYNEFLVMNLFPIEDYTIEWVCVLSIKCAVTEEMLDKKHSLSQDRNDTNVYMLGHISRHNVVIVCLLAEQIGTNSAATVTSQMTSKFVSIKFGLIVDIREGVLNTESDIRLGDIVISQLYI
jgi:hypothetical protein